MTAGSTLAQHLIRNASRAPERNAFLTREGDMQYGEFVARIGWTASRLRARGIEPGERILLCAPNSPEVAIAYFAIHWLGAVAVPVEPGIPEASLRWIFADCDARLAIVEGRETDLPEIVSLGAITAGSGPGPLRDPCCEPNDDADILYTTGTTGTRKGVVLTHGNILSAAVNITEFLRNGENDIEVVPLPLSHSFGLGRLRCMALNGNCVVLERNLSNPAGFLKQLVDLRATGLALVPSGFEILRRLTRDCIGTASTHLRYIEIGSMPMRDDTRGWLMRMLPDTRICHHYGLTEASRAAFTEYHSDADRPGTIGRAAPNVEITIRDEMLATVPARKTGEIVVRGAMVMREYWKRPDLTAAALSESGLRTGDHGYLDEDGYLYLLGREDDLINVGGLKVIPEEVEEKIRQYPGVRDAVCIGIPDPLGLSGQCVKAFIVADTPVSVAGLKAWLRGQLEEYKIPGVIEHCAEIPRTSSGKPQRYKLRELDGANGS
jgi:long-chain acyl-CoA synthetase